ncbi:MAG: DHH family phosphoesterase [Haloarculaceae archaeon]
MDSRLVLGCGSVGHDVVDAIRDRPGDVVVATGDDRRVETLRNEGVPARRVDVTDERALRDVAGSLAGEVTLVAVVSDDPGRNLAAARTARRLFPDAMLFAYAGRDATATIRQGLAAVADTVFDPGTAVIEAIGARAGEQADRVERLREVLAAVEGTLAIVTHDNPDPDAIASALALQRVARAFGVAADVCYFGDISHQENRALVNLLDYDLTNLDPDADLSSYGGFALVDHSRPGVNDGLPEDVTVDAVVDHHPPRGPVDARFRDLRSDAGATSTLLVDYLEQLDLDVDPAIATGLLFGIRVDTRDFSREVCARDYEAAAYLLPRADVDALDRIESPSVGLATMQLLADAISNRHVSGGVLTTCAGYVGDRDALAQAADQLLDMESVHTTLVYGVMEGTVYLSARSRGADLDLGEALREAFDQIGSAGGHADMAGAQLPLGLLGDPAEVDRDRLIEVVDELVRNRFLEVVAETPPDVPLPAPSDLAYYRDEGE